MKGELNKVPASERPEYEIREDEQNLYHVELINIEFNSATKETEELVNIQKFSKEEWKRYQNTAVIKSYDRQNIVHDPSKKVEKKKVETPKK